MAVTVPRPTGTPSPPGRTCPRRPGHAAPVPGTSRGDVRADVTRPSGGWPGEALRRAVRWGRVGLGPRGATADERTRSPRTPGRPEPPSSAATPRPQQRPPPGRPPTARHRARAATGRRTGPRRRRRCRRDDRARRRAGRHRAGHQQRARCRRHRSCPARKGPVPGRRSRARTRPAPPRLTPPRPRAGSSARRRGADRTPAHQALTRCSHRAQTAHRRSHGARGSPGAAHPDAGVQRRGRRRRHTQVNPLTRRAVRADTGRGGEAAGGPARDRSGRHARSPRVPNTASANMGLRRGRGLAAEQTRARAAVLRRYPSR